MNPKHRSAFQRLLESKETLASKAEIALTWSRSESSVQNKADKEPTTPSVTKWIVISAIIGYLVLLFFLFTFVDMGNLISVLRSINLSVYALALLCVIISISFHSMVWYQLLSSLSMKLGFRRTYVLYWVGIFVDSLVPGGWSGDLFKAYLLSRDPELDTGKAVASVVAKNFYEAMFNLGSMIIGVLFLIVNYNVADSSIFLYIGVIMVLLTVPILLLILMSFKPAEAKNILGALLRRLNLSRFQAKMEKMVDDYHEGMKGLLQNPRMFLKPLMFSFLAWSFEVLTLLLVFASLGEIVPVGEVMIVRSIAGNLEAQGFAFVGYAQIVTTALYTALGIPIALSASVALLGGLVVFWLKTGISYVAFHCTVFAPCHNYVCRAIGVEGYPKKKKCETEGKPS